MFFYGYKVSHFTPQLIWKEASPHKGVEWKNLYCHALRIYVCIYVYISIGVFIAHSP